MNSMHTQQDGTPTPKPAAVDLTQGTEVTRRILYDLVVAVHFNPTPEELQRAAEDPDNHWVPTYTPEAAGLVLHYLHGRYAESRIMPSCRWR
jgi:hypothetical protein